MQETDATDNDVTRLLKQRARSRMAHAVNLFVDGGVFLDERVGFGEIGFRLVIVVIRHKIFGRRCRERTISFRCKAVQPAFYYAP